MRAALRSAALQRPGLRRRRGATHPEPLVLQLQRTIGNRATTRLLQRQPTGTAQRTRPHVLKDAGITTTSQVDRDTPKLIQAALEESLKLKPYLKGKFPGSAITAKGAFEIHTRAQEFHEAVKTAKNVPGTLTKHQLEERFGKVAGVFNRSTRVIHVRSYTQFGNAVHEAMHRIAHPAFHGFWDEFINEGVTQYFADCLLGEQGLSRVTNHEYKRELECATNLVAATDFDTVARAYFLNDADKLRQALMTRFKIDLDTLRREVRSGKLCERLAPTSRP